MQRTFQFVFLATFHKQGGIHVKATGALTLCIKGIVSPAAVEDATAAGSEGLPASGEQMGRTYGIPLVFTLLNSSVCSCSLP